MPQVMKDTENLFCESTEEESFRLGPNVDFWVEVNYSYKVDHNYIISSVTSNVEFSSVVVFLYVCFDPNKISRT